jgi:predicted DsbA family dithiol-disulfide isomerase
MKVTYHLEVVSSWCYWSEPAWAELKRRYAGRVAFDWKIAKMTAADWPVSRAQCEWFYRRSGTVMRSPYMLNAGWYEPFPANGYPAASFVAEAARDFGFTGDEIRLALAHAADREGRKVGQMAEAIAARIEASTRDFLSHQITQRPAFVVEDEIGDKAVFSGLVRVEPLAAAIDAMLADTAAYASFTAHFGGPPPV